MAKAPTAHALLPSGASFLGSGKHHRYEKAGGIAQADADFDVIAGIHPVVDHSNGLRTCGLPDGTTVSVRPHSSAGPPTLQINPPSGTPIKVRYVS
jgi:hypothetical protein